MIFVLDTSVIIAFMTEMDDGEYLQALSSLGNKLIITTGVRQEVKKEPGVSRLRRAIEEGWIEVQQTSKSEFDFFKVRYPMLDYAEIEVIQKGLEFKFNRSDYCCVLDEGAGRRIADSLGVNKTGTEGLLNRINHLGIIDEKIEEKLLSKLDYSSFRSASSSSEKK